MTPSHAPIPQPFPRLEKDLFTQPALPVEQSEPRTTLSPSFSLPSPPHLGAPIVFGRPNVQRSSSPPLDPEHKDIPPLQMPSPNTPSPPAAYGIAGGLIVTEQPIMQNATTTSTAECQPLLPSQADVFGSSHLVKTHRPVLRPSFSHNAVLNTPSPANWPRRLMTTGSTPDDPSINGSRVNERARPSTAGTIHDSTSVHHFAPPEASHDPIPPFSALTTAHPNHFPGHPISINTNTYSDELSFHTTSYNGSYDSSYSNSPWSVDPQPQSRSLQYYPVSAMSQMSYRSDHPYKQDEPILAPGEIPAPRPPMSYAALIGEALLLAPPPHNLYVSEISDSIKRRNAYYRQNPTKIYNGVRHQTSMCKAFVKLPRPFGDQSGGARKWAIRAGCETWFSGGGYHPPGSLPVPQVQGRKAGKAKSTARSKQLAIGTEDFPKSVTPYSAGPSSGPAFDGSTRPTAYQQTGYHGPGFLPPGYHYVPVPPSHGHGHNHAQAHNGQPVYVPIWGPYPPPGPDPNIYRQQAQAQGYSSSPEQWRQQYEEHRGQYLGNGHEDPRGNYDAFRESPVTVQGSRGSSYGPSSEGH